MPYSTVYGHNLFYTRSERDPQPGCPPLVLLHGAGGSHLHWPPQLRRLPGAVIYTLDLPGHGRSTGAGFSTIAGYRDAVGAWADVVGVDRFVLGGVSMGSAIALDFALAYPKRVEGLAIVAGSARLRVAPAILDGLQQDFMAATELINRLSYSTETPAAVLRLALKHLREARPETLYGDFVACHAFDVTARLGEITQPALIVCGSQDQMTPPKLSQHLQQHLPAAELHLIDGAGHMAMIEQPPLVAQLFQSFLQGLLTDPQLAAGKT